MSEFKTQNQFEKLKKRKKYLIALILLFAIVIAWIGVSVFSSQQKLGISPEDKKLAQPIKPSLNIQTIEVLEQKRVYSDQELDNFPVLAEVEDESGNVFLMDVQEARELERNQAEARAAEEEAKRLEAEQAAAQASSQPEATSSAN